VDGPDSPERIQTRMGGRGGAQRAEGSKSDGRKSYGVRLKKKNHLIV